MYGNDAFFNGYLPTDPETGYPFYITSIAPSTLGTPLYTVTFGSPVRNTTTNTVTMTNVAQNDYNFFQYNFTRWVMRVAGTVASGTAGSVNQTFEILGDSGFSANSSSARTFTIAIGPTDGQTIYSQDAAGFFTPMGTAFSLTGTPTGTLGTSLYNPTQGVTTALIGQLLYTNATASATGTAGLSIPFQLDGRWLHAFGGTGMGSVTNATTSVPNSAYGNFRYNGYLNVGGPNSVGMDEDYDACDLENWFLAIQSADGQVMIPSFHRPANVRFDPTNTNNPINDWQNVNPVSTNVSVLAGFADSASRILRPRFVDGHDQNTFPDLVPDPTTGKIGRYVGYNSKTGTYSAKVGDGFDVDNDGDGANDSVWLDLGYPARRDSRGQLYKPLFAFMVIGLNGRIPLNTAGNLAGAGSTHAEHLGNSVSEVDPTYGLQNAFVGTYAGDYDPFNILGIGTWPPTVTSGTNTYNTSNTQVDNSTYPLTVGDTGGTDVRFTQLRNILAGTRPQLNPFSPDTTGLINGDNNTVYGAFASSTSSIAYSMPNGTADLGDLPQPAAYTDSNGNPLVLRTNDPVGGRWGEAASVPGVPFANSTAGMPPYNLVQTKYMNPVRAGYSFDITDLFNNLTYSNSSSSTPTPFPRDAADDNFTAFDVYPARTTGEVGDQDYYDLAGGFLLPVERIRRWVTPADINGTGRVVQWNATATGGAIGRGSFLGADNFGRVQFNSYFRPAGAAGAINVKYAYNAANTPPTTPSTGNALGVITYPTTASATTSTTPTTTDPYYGAGPNPINPVGPVPLATAFTPPVTLYSNYLPDLTNNPFHGYESFKVVNLVQNPGTTYTGATYTPQTLSGGMPMDQGTLSTANPGLALNVPATVPTVPATLPTYDNKVNSTARSDGVNEADETNLYTPNPLLDSPYGPSDLEWLYRQDDVDGSTLTSRLSQLAPVSFTNNIDGQRRRRLYALDAWELTNSVWANDNPGGAFAGNAWFTPTQSASFSTLSTTTGSIIGTPTLAQRDKKINLNYPLPVSNDCNEPVRQKWISDTYQLLKWTLPPDSVDTAEELAQLSQFIINIVDFRDPDATMTHWINPDVVLSLSGTSPTTNPPVLTKSVGSGALDQYGMEYNPVAINETLAYSFTSKTGGATYTQTNRFFIELVNTLSAAFNTGYDYAGSPQNNYYGNASALNLGGFNYIGPPTNPVSDPYAGGCWDLVFTSDDPMSRPDPYRGELSVSGGVAGKINYYGLIPLNRDTFATGGNPAAINQGDVTLLPVSPASTSVVSSPVTLPAAQTLPPTTYFYVIGNPANTTSYNTEANPPSTTTTYAGAACTPTVGPSVTQTVQPNYDPLSTTATNIPTFAWHPGILPGAPTGIPANFSWKLPLFPQSTISAGATARPGDELLGLPAPTGQSVRARLGDQPDVRGRQYEVPLHRRNRQHDHNRARRQRQHQHIHERAVQHHLLGPAPPALSRRPRRRRPQRHRHHDHDAAA